MYWVKKKKKKLSNELLATARTRLMQFIYNYLKTQLVTCNITKLMQYLSLRRCIWKITYDHYFLASTPKQPYSVQNYYSNTCTLLSPCQWQIAFAAWDPSVMNTLQTWNYGRQSCFLCECSSCCLGSLTHEYFTNLDLWKTVLFFVWVFFTLLEIPQSWILHKLGTMEDSLVFCVSVLNAAWDPSVMNT